MAPEMLAPDCSRFRSAQYRREILCEFGSRHHVLAPCRAARGSANSVCHERENPITRRGLPGAFDLTPGSKFSLQSCSTASSDPCRAFKSTITSAAGYAAAAFRSCSPVATVWSEMPVSFAVSSSFAWKKKIVYQYDCIGHDCLSSFSRAQAKHRTRTKIRPFDVPRTPPQHKPRGRELTEVLGFSLWPSVILRALCVAFFGVHHGGQKTREKKW